MASRIGAESAHSAHRTHRNRLRRAVAVLTSSVALVAATLVGTVVTGAVSPAAATPGWSALGAGVNGGVSAIATDAAGNVYIGGHFTTAGGVSANRVAKWSPSTSTWSTLGSGVANPVKALAIDSVGNVYAAGDQSCCYGGWISKWNASTSTWSSLGAPDGPVYSLAVDSSDNLYVGGGFNDMSAVSRRNVAKWNGSSWSSMGSGLGNTVQALAVDGSDNLYAGGGFNPVYGAPNRVARWDSATSSWVAVGGGTNGVVYELATDASGNVYASGFFTTAGGVSANSVAKWVPTANAGVGEWQAMSANGIDDLPSALAVDASGNVYAGGQFTYAGTTSASHVAMWNGSSWSGLGSGTDGIVNALATSPTGVVYVGGSFTSAGGVAASRIAAWTPPPALSLTTSSLSAATVGSAYSQTLTATGGVSPYTWSVTSGSLPAGLALNASTGVISGTPTAATTSSFTVQVTDSLSTTATASLSITTSVAPLAVSTSSLSAATVGSAYSQTLTATGGTSPYMWAVTSGSLPTGLSLNTTTGVIDGTPTAAGTSAFTVEVTDSRGTPATATASLSITVATASTTNTNGGGSSGGGSSGGGSSSGGSSQSTSGSGGSVGSADDDVVALPRPKPVLYSVLALGDVCPAGWSGPTWEPWPNGGKGGRACNKTIEWSVDRDAYEIDPVATLSSAREWHERIARLAAHIS